MNKMAPLISDTEASGPFLFWDGYGLDKKGSGIHRHAKEIASQLKLIGVRPLLVGSNNSSYDLDTDIISAGTKFLPHQLYSSKLMWSEVAAKTLKQKKFKKGIIHGFSNINIPIYGSSGNDFSKVITVHDLIPLLKPDSVSKLARFQFGLRIKHVLSQADQIVAVSNWTKKTIIKYFPKCESKILVIPNGHNRWQSDLSKKSDKIQLLSVSRYETYKNLDFLFEVAQNLSSDFHLTLVTNQEGFRELKSKYKDLISQQRATILCNVSDIDLDRLFSQANILLHPSDAEGYCLPAAEATSRGVPVVYKSGSGIDEVVGDETSFGLCSLSPSDWVTTIYSKAEIKYDPEYRKRLKRHVDGKQHWEEVAKTLNQLYVTLGL